MLHEINEVLYSKFLALQKCER